MTLFSCWSQYLFLISLNPIQGGSFQGCSRMGAKKPPHPQNLSSHISYYDKTKHSYTLPKEDSENI